MSNPALALGTGLAGLLSGLFKKKSKDAQAKEQRRSMIASLNLRQKQQEDSRLGRLQLAQSILSHIPAQSAGGRVNTNVYLDPAVMERLGQERQYDFSSAVPDETKGGAWGFLSGLFGDVGNTLPYMAGGGRPGGMGVLQGVDVPTGATAPTAAGQPGGALSIEDLLGLGTYAGSE